MRYVAPAALGLIWSAVAMAQMAVPDAPKPDGAQVFRNQCATCHSLKASDPGRQGPNLEHVFGRQIGSVAGYAYTPGYRESGETWTAEKLDKYIANPQAMFPGSTMSYRQSNPSTRQTIIAFLKDQG